MPRMRKYYPKLRGKTPVTPPDWRCERAAEMIAKSQYASLRRDDWQTVELARFMRKILRLKERAAVNLLNQNRDLSNAVFLATSAPGLLPELHARLLANQGFETIGAHMDLPPGAVTWYADLFFDVRPRLGATFWIHFNAIRGCPNEPPTPVQLFLTQAYHRGPQVIPAWLDYLANHAGPHDLSTESGRQRESIALLVESQTLTSSPTTAAKHVRLSQILLGIKPEMFRNRSTQSEFGEILNQMTAEAEFPLRLEPPKPPATSSVSGEPCKPDKIDSFLCDVYAVRDAVQTLQLRSRTTSRLVAQ